MDGAYASYTNWSKNEPNNYTDKKNCGEINSKSGRWHDRDCRIRMSFICEGKKGKFEKELHIINSNLSHKWDIEECS